MTSLEFLNFNKPKNTIQWIVFLAAIGITLSSPVGTRAFIRELNKYLSERGKRKSYNARELSQALYYLKKRKVIKITENNGEIVLNLTEQGKKRKLQYDLENLIVTKPKQWDKKWRILMFDIPEEKREGRDALREKLRQLGFIRFQKSVWLYPYPCENEIDFLTEYFGIAQCVNLITVKLENDKPLRQEFKL